jgi:hypothetical protein
MQSATLTRLKMLLAILTGIAADELYRSKIPSHGQMPPLVMLLLVIAGVAVFLRAMYEWKHRDAH